jgi:hypothetical protein
LPLVNSTGKIFLINLIIENINSLLVMAKLFISRVPGRFAPATVKVFMIWESALVSFYLAFTFVPYRPNGIIRFNTGLNASDSAFKLNLNLSFKSDSQYLNPILKESFQW